ncbi:hypothetical protein DBV05_g12659 [Lasiodiplodia theobromae]|uniref:Uncharacterized protein n=1 Tax=Lasiodiplodia theobromae TaxID=45133 RepID=A0A5N5CTK1_9PEZI|nr:hypothetical protein DBV05_g12659 [Lasiodiplodia theobromae]
MISSTKPLPSSLRSHLARPKPLPPARRCLTVDATPSDAPYIVPPHLTAAQRLQNRITHESKLNQLRNAFLPPGKQYLSAVKVKVPDDALAPHPEDRLTSSVRRLVEKQLEQCSYRTDYLNLVSALLMAQKDLGYGAKHGAVRLICANLLYQVFDQPAAEAAGASMLALVHQIRFKLEDQKISLPDTLIGLGLLCAANNRNYPALKLYLRAHRQHFPTSPIDPKIFARLIDIVSYADCTAKPRPSSWLAPWRHKHVKAVLLGFDDLTPAERAASTPPFHLGALLPRDSWGCVSRWLRALARHDALPQLRRELDLWLADPSRTDPKFCHCPQQPPPGSPATKLTNDRVPMWRLNAVRRWNTRARGDLALLDAFCRVGGHAGVEDAWRVFGASEEIEFGMLNRGMRAAMLAKPESIPAGKWTEEMREAVVQKYKEDLRSIEGVLGVQWVWDPRTGRGYHRIPKGSLLADLKDFTDDLMDYAVVEFDEVGVDGGEFGVGGDELGVDDPGSEDRTS